MSDRRPELKGAHSSTSSGGLDQFRELRAAYLDETLTQADRRLLSALQASASAAGLEVESVADAAKPGELQSRALSWGDWRFHLKNRIHLRSGHSDALERLVDWAPELAVRRGELARLTGEGVADEDGVRWLYDFSLLPLNALLGEKVRSYFVPPSDYFVPHTTKRPDPYGLLWAKSRALTAIGKPVAVVDSETQALLGSHKFTHTLLMNLDFYCPIGCSDCYKSRLGTREFATAGNERGSSVYTHPDFGRAKPPSRGGVLAHARRVADWLQYDPRGQGVYDVILSGGEPLIIGSETIHEVLGVLGQAPGLRVLRICTGCLFLGLPMRMDQEFVNVLRDFQNTTGVRVTIQAHLACHEQITPEAVIALRRLREAGISVYSQVPIKVGINFFPQSSERTLAELSLLGRQQVITGVEPYMFIVDMHPSTNQFYVPLEPLLGTWGELVESHAFPGLERPRTLSILFPGGNIILTGGLLLAMSKSVDRARGAVAYRIPRLGLRRGGTVRPYLVEYFEYEEPLCDWNDDPESLERLRRRWAKACASASREQAVVDES